jgi:hypothetical protein
MAVPFLRITQVQAAAMLQESIGALGVQSTIPSNVLAIRPHQGIETVVVLSGVQGTPDFTDLERNAIVNALQPFVVSSLGTFAFVLPYERYFKAILAANDALNPGLPLNQQAALAAAIHNQDPSEAFGLNGYSDIHGSASQIQFVTDFPGTVITAWQIDMINRPGGLPQIPKRTWVADVIRNSFAHGQTEIEIQGDTAGVRMVNRRNAAAVGSFNFSIWMPMRQFEKLVATALRHFIINVVQGGVYEPLDKLLLLSL